MLEHDKALYFADDLGFLAVQAIPGVGRSAFVSAEQQQPVITSSRGGQSTWFILRHVAATGALGASAP
jgi:hypothetical protein